MSLFSNATTPQHLQQHVKPVASTPLQAILRSVLEELKPVEVRYSGKIVEPTLPIVSLNTSMIESVKLEGSMSENIIEVDVIKLFNDLDIKSVQLPSRGYRAYLSSWYRGGNQVETNYLIRDIITTIKQILHETGLPIVDELENHLTRPEYLDTEFISSNRFLQIVYNQNSYKFRILYDPSKQILVIAGKVSSFTEQSGTTYDVAVILTPKDGRVNVISGCTCPVGENPDVVCKHVLGLLLVSLPVVLAYMETVYRKTTFSKHLVKKYEAIIRKHIGNKPRDYITGVIYYMGKLFFRQFPQAVLYTGNLHDLVETVMSEDKLEKYILKGFVLELPQEEIEVIDYTEDIERLRVKITKLIDELSLKLGRTESKDLVVALVGLATLSSDKVKPPMLGLLVGEPGTDKSTSVRLLAKHIYDLRLEVASSLENYYKVLEAIGEYTGVPVHELSKKENIFVSNIELVKTGNDTPILRYYVNLVETYSYLYRRYGDKALDKLVELIEKINEHADYITIRKEPVSLGIIDNSRIGVMTEDIILKPIGKDFIAGRMLFNSKIILLDELMRGGATDLVLTVLSMSSIDNPLLLAVDTENPSPYIRAISNPDTDAYRSRALFGVIATQLFNIDRQIKYINTPPKNWVSLAELYKAEKIIEKIPVPSLVEYLINAVRNYMYRTVLLVELDDVVAEMILPVNFYKKFRDKLEGNILVSPPEIEAIYDARFIVYTVRMAQYIAFLNKHRYVEITDLLEALRYTLFPRINFRNPETIQLEYTNILYDIEAKVKDAVKKENIALIYSRAKTSDENAMRKLHEKVYSNPLLIHLYIGYIEYLYRVKGLEAFEDAPKHALYTLASIIFFHGDAEDHKRFMEKYPEIYRKVRDYYIKILLGDKT